MQIVDFTSCGGCYDVFPFKIYLFEAVGETEKFLALAK